MGGGTLLSSAMLLKAQFRKEKAICLCSKGAPPGRAGVGSLTGQLPAWEHPCQGGKLTSTGAPASTPGPVADSCKASRHHGCDVWKGRGSVPHLPGAMKISRFKKTRPE